MTAPTSIVVLRRGRGCHYLTTTMGYSSISTNPQIVIRHSIKQRVIFLTHYPVTADHPGRPQTLLSHQTKVLLARSSRDMLRYGTQLKLLWQETHQDPSKSRLHEAIPRNSATEIGRHWYTRRINPHTNWSYVYPSDQKPLQQTVKNY